LLSQPSFGVGELLALTNAKVSGGERREERKRRERTESERQEGGEGDERRPRVSYHRFILRIRTE
jgi:hypothetical protein